MGNDSPDFRSSYAFAVCNAGSEAVLKAEVTTRLAKLLRPAFMRPQLITWKSDRPLDGRFRLESIFARVSGLSVGHATSEEEVATLVAGTLGTKPLHLHVFPREVPENGLSPEEWARTDAASLRIAGHLRAAGVEVHDSGAPRPGERVLDVILDEDPKNGFFVGVHRHERENLTAVGGLPRITLAEDVPSRAWLKLEQALIFAGLDAGGALKGKVALELGCAPGGSTLALLHRGVSVFGVDAGQMDERVTRFEPPEGTRFVHYEMSADDLPAALLPQHVDILLSDINASPKAVLPILERYQERLKVPLMILTLKLNDRLTVTRIPEFLRRVRAFAPGPIRTMQLPANRSEFCVVAGRL